MQVVEIISQMKELRGKARGAVGFVPTMGYLHEGHLRLVRRARADNDVEVVSIFVNPTQFGPHEDFERYPRDIEKDLSLLVREKVDYVFMPSVQEMYPLGYSTYVDVEGITEKLEGASRVGHFRGVATVVAKLFNILHPTRAYFGQKDAQQVIVIKKMVADLDMNLEIVVVPTVREPDGLAMSSRNVYLSPEEREAATVLYRAISLAERLYYDGVRDADRLREDMRVLIEDEPLADIDYVSVADARTLQELDKINGPVLASLAVRIGKTRLIDNIVLP